MESDAGSTVPRRQLGRFLRSQRESANITIKMAADELECSPQKIWRIEKGSVPVRATDVKILCQLYEATADMTTGLVALARETKAKGWWHAYGDAVPGWFELYVGLEGAATRVRKYEPALIPGLLQAHAYMESVVRADRPDLEDADVERRMAVKMERQGLLSRHFPPPPHLEVIICEGALRRTPAVPGAMAQQLWHLLKANERPHVSVRALPLGAGPHRASVSGAFTILDFPPDEAGRHEPSTIYSESLTGALYLDKPGETETYDAVWADLAKKALDPDETDKFVTTLIEEMNNREQPSRRRSGASPPHSGANGDCVEVADNLPDLVGVRDSKDPIGPALVFGPAAWRVFVRHIKQH